MISLPCDWRERSTSDGRVTLRLPAEWGQAFEEETGTTYFGVDDDAKGVLRITPLVFSKNGDIRRDELPTLFSNRPEHADVHVLTETRCFVAYAEEGEEDGEPLIQQYWETIQQIDAHRVILSIGTYTLGMGESLDSETSLISALGISFRNAEIRETSEE